MAWLKLAFLLASVLFTQGLACKCVPPTVYRTYYQNDVVNYVKATVISSSTQEEIGLIQYGLSIEKNFKGCTLGKTYVVYSRESSAACGVTLNVGKQYVLPLRTGATPMIFLCDFIEEYKNLSDDQSTFLETRNVCCNDICECADGLTYACLVNPCDYSTPPCPKAVKCVANYCGGCFAEWFDSDGMAACK